MIIYFSDLKLLIYKHQSVLKHFINTCQDGVADWRGIRFFSICTQNEGIIILLLK